MTVLVASSEMKMWLLIRPDLLLSPDGTAAQVKARCFPSTFKHLQSPTIKAVHATLSSRFRDFSLLGRQKCATSPLLLLEGPFFSFPYPYVIIRLSIICLGLSLVRFPSIFPSMTILSSKSPLSVLCLFLIVCIRALSSPSFPTLCCFICFHRKGTKDNSCVYANVNQDT